MHVNYSILTETSKSMRLHLVMKVTKTTDTILLEKNTWIFYGYILRFLNQTFFYLSIFLSNTCQSTRTNLQNLQISSGGPRLVWMLKWLKCLSWKRCQNDAGDFSNEDSSFITADLLKTSASFRVQKKEKVLIKVHNALLC